VVIRESSTSFRRTILISSSAIVLRESSVLKIPSKCQCIQPPKMHFVTNRCTHFNLLFIEAIAVRVRQLAISVSRLDEIICLFLCDHVDVRFLQNQSVFHEDKRGLDKKQQTNLIAEGDAKVLIGTNKQFRPERSRNELRFLGQLVNRICKPHPVTYDDSASHCPSLIVKLPSTCPNH
ncbi:hypothetical protein Tcan_07426, partial [Toxocara canis]